MKSVDYNQLSEWGLIYKINKDVLHPLGLSLSRDPKTGVSESIFIDSTEDLEWEYPTSMSDEEEIKLLNFLNNRVTILTMLNELSKKD